MNTTDSEGPLFIIGNPRSGTSLLRLILTSHSRILIPPECGFIIWLRNQYADWQHSDFGTCGRIETFLDDLYACKKFDTWLLDRSLVSRQILIRQPTTYADLCAAVYASFGVKSGKDFLVWGDKNNFHLNHLEELLNLYKTAKFLHIVRDGRDVACSYREVMETRSASPYAPKLDVEIGKIALEWSNNVMKVDAFLSGVSNESAMSIRYEDLVSQPRQAIMSLCNWLGLSYEQEMLDFYQLNKAKKLEPDLTMDWKKRTLQPIDETTVNRHLKLLSREEQTKFLALAGKALHRFSYA